MGVDRLPFLWEGGTLDKNAAVHVILLLTFLLSLG